MRQGSATGLNMVWNNAKSYERGWVSDGNYGNTDMAVSDDSATIDDLTNGSPTHGWF